jgi:hypothetical protein
MTGDRPEERALGFGLALKLQERMSLDKVGFARPDANAPIAPDE